MRMEQGMDSGPVRGDVTGAGEADARVRAAYAALPGLLERHAPTDPEVLLARIELGEACSAAGLHEDAVQQIDELVKDCLRAHGEDHPLSREARELEARSWERARAGVAGREAR